MGIYRVLPQTNPVRHALLSKCPEAKCTMLHAPYIVMQGSPSPLSQPQQVPRAHSPLAIATRQAQPIPSKAQPIPR